MTRQVRIALLADHPGLIGAIAPSVWTEWGYATEDDCAADLRASGRDTLPVAYVAVDDEEPVGIVSLIDCNLPPRCDLRPWLAGLFVWPEHRSRGVGTALTRHLEADARRLGHARLHLYTTHAERFYERLGWTTMDRAEWEGAPIAIMTRDVPPT